YTLASNAKSISYTKATTALTLASVKGAVSKTGLSVSGKKIKLKKSALSSKVTVSGGDYEFDFASDYGTATIVGSSKADTITVRGKKVSINAGKGDDTIKMLGTATVNGGAGADTFVYQSGKHVIKNYAEEDKISITSGTAEIASSGDNIIFTVGSGKITVTGGKDKTISYIDESGERTYLTQSTQPVIIKGKKITLTEDYLDATFNVADYGAALQTIDASAAQRNLKITGNALKNLIKGTDDDDTIDGGASADIIDGGKGNDSILGDTGNDSIFGGAGDDTIIGGAGTDSLTGGTGADVFVWNKGDGNDKITDCKEEDTILINGDTVSTIKASTDKKDLIFTLASKSTITLTGGADKIISYTDAKGEHVHSQFVKFTDKGTSATLAEGYPNKTFDQSNYSKYADDLATINASKVQHEMIILGNGKANSIMGTKEDDTINGFAGKDILLGNDGNDSLNGGTGNDKLYGGTGNDTLWGNAGNDSLWGGHGEDVFIYKPSEDTDRIFDYDFHYDKIMLLSGTVDNVAEIDEDIVFTIGTGKIILDRAAGKYAKVVDSSGKLLKDTTNMR
ncbi:MAG: calcium-binding protein, partial [Quinella sp. 1Q5]|nr:calcium-binding protein [Quinella sp. 1Q5]